MLQFAVKLFSFFQISHSYRCNIRFTRQIYGISRCIVFMLFFLWQNMVSAQGINISTSTRVTNVIGTTGFFRGLSTANKQPIKAANIYALRVGTRLAKDNFWHKAFGYPEVGLGLEYLNIHNDGEIGNPLSLYAFVEAGLVDMRKFRLSLNIDFGASYFWKPFNSTTNLNNITLGSSLNYHVGLGLRANFYLTENISLLISPILNHHSNGAVTKPNLGINMGSLEVGLKYYLTERARRTQWTDSVRHFKPHTEISFFTGSRNVDPDGPYHQFYGIHVNRMYHLASRFIYGAGLEFLYDEASFAGRTNKGFDDRFSVAFYVSGAVVLDRVSLSMDFGRYMIRQDNDRIPVSQYYQRMSLRFRLNDELFMALKVRAFELRKADLLEVHFGLRI